MHKTLYNISRGGNPAHACGRPCYFYTLMSELAEQLPPKQNYIGCWVLGWTWTIRSDIWPIPSLKFTEA